MPTNKKKLGPEKTSDNMQYPTPIYDDEINLMDLFLVIWKRKWLIALFSIIPPIVVGLFLFLSPRDYTVTYTYETQTDEAQTDEAQTDEAQTDEAQTDEAQTYNATDKSKQILTKKNYEILLVRFFSKENQKKIVDEFIKEDLDSAAKSVADSKDGLKKFVEFEVSPSFPDISKMKNLDAAKIKQLQNTSASLLKLQITATPKDHLEKICSVIRNNYESVFALDDIEQSLRSSINTYRESMANIEKNRYPLLNQLKRKKAILHNLKMVKTKAPVRQNNDILLNFDIGNKSQYLPISRQIEAVESSVVNLEETIKNNELDYKHFQDLYALDSKLLAEVVKRKMSSEYTMDHFLSYLYTVLKDINKEEIRDYLNSYIKNIENLIASKHPITSTPRILPVSKGTLKIAAIVFVLSIMIALFAAFLMEGIKKRNEEMKA